MIPRFTFVDCSIPKGYTCFLCERQGCKLWRKAKAGDVPGERPLWCCDCAAKELGIDVSRIDAKGCRPADPHGFYRTDCIGDLIPAVPREDGSGRFWAYLEVPEAGIKWWTNLSTRKGLDAVPNLC
jgi:hypothetical protein